MGAVGEWLAESARRADADIIGWSTFDRDQIARSADVPAVVQAVIRERYVNAIPVAKTWQRALLPQWHLEANALKASCRTAAPAKRRRMT